MKKLLSIALLAMVMLLGSLPAIKAILVSMDYSDSTGHDFALLRFTPSRRQ